MRPNGFGCGVGRLEGDIIWSFGEVVPPNSGSARLTKRDTVWSSRVLLQRHFGILHPDLLRESQEALPLEIIDMSHFVRVGPEVSEA
jgi:hypothetical protein